MQRFGCVVKLRPDKIEDYEKYHSDVWPDVLKAINDSGICSYTIYRYNEWLFSHFELPDDISMEDAEKKIAADPTCQEWDPLMISFFDPLPESTDGSWLLMKEVWHQEEN